MQKVKKRRESDIIALSISNFVSIHQSNLELYEFGLLEQTDIDKEFQVINELTQEFFKIFYPCKTKEDIRKKLVKIFRSKRDLELGIRFCNTELINHIFMIDIIKVKEEEAIYFALFLATEFCACPTRTSVIKHFKESFVF